MACDGLASELVFCEFECSYKKLVLESCYSFRIVRSFWQGLRFSHTDQLEKFASSLDAHSTACYGVKHFGWLVGAVVDCYYCNREFVHVFFIAAFRPGSEVSGTKPVSRSQTRDELEILLLFGIASDPLCNEKG